MPADINSSSSELIPLAAPIVPPEQPVASAAKNRVVANLLAMGSGQITTWLISTLYFYLVARYLGPTIQGEFAVAGFIVSLAALCLGLGMDTLITRTVARDPARAAVLTTAAIAARMILVAPIFGALLLYMAIGGYNAETRLIADILFAAMFIGLLVSPLGATLVGREKMGYQSITMVLQNLLELALIIAFILLRFNVVLIALTNVIVAFVNAGLYIRWMAHSTRLTWGVTFADVRFVVTGSLVFWITNVFLTFYIAIDSIILVHMANNTAVGMYSVATRLFGVLLFLPSIVAMATLPLMSRLGIDVATDFTRVARKTLSLLMVGAIPLSIGMATFAQPLIVTIFRSTYAQAAPVLSILSLCALFTCLTTQFGQMTVASDRQGLWTIAMIGACIVNPICNVALIPYATHHWHNPALGAAWALVATEALMTVYGVIVWRRIILHSTFVRAFGGALIAGAIQLGVIWLARPLWPWIGQLLGAASYGASAVALGAIPYREALQLREIAFSIARRRHQQ